MLDIKFVRSNPDVVKENIKKKFQDEKLPLVDEVLSLLFVLIRIRFPSRSVHAWLRVREKKQRY